MAMVLVRAAALRLAAIDASKFFVSFSRRSHTPHLGEKVSTIRNFSAETRPGFRSAPGCRDTRSLSAWVRSVYRSGHKDAGTEIAGSRAKLAREREMSMKARSAVALWHSRKALQSPL